MAKTTAATYGADPANSQLDEVRLLIGDTDCPTACLLDSEITFFLGKEGSAAFAAIRAAEACAAKCVRAIDTSTGSVRRALSQKFAQYKILVKDLKTRADELGGAPIFTALTLEDKRQDRIDSGLVQPNFRIAQDDNPRKVRSRDELLGTTTSNP